MKPAAAHAQALAAILGCLALAGHAAEAAKDPAPEFRLSEPNVVRVDRRAEILVSGDLNGDGATDLAVAANDRGTLQLLLHEEKSEGVAFKKTEVPLNRAVRSMVALDIDGDGRTDLLLARPPANLAAMYQGEDGRLGPPKEFDIPGEYLAVADIDGDDRQDVLVASDTQKSLQILRGQTRGLSLEAGPKYFTTGKLIHPPFVFDADGDGKSDLVYLDGGDFTKLVYRLQSPDGDFPAEFRLDAGTVRDVAPFVRKDGSGAIAAVLQKTRELALLGLAEARTDGAEDGAPVFSGARIIGLDAQATGSEVISAVADVDGDGRLDLIVGSPKAPSLTIVRQTRSGSLRPVTKASLTGLRQIIAWPAPAGSPAPLLLVSKDEKAIAAARFDDDAPESLRFPRPLEIEGQPLAGAAAMLSDGKQADLAVLVKGADDAVSLVAYPGFDPSADGLPKAKELYKLPTGADAPTGLLAADLDRDHRTDFVLFFEYQEPSVVMQDGKGAFAAKPAAGVLSGMLTGLSPATLSPAMLAGEDSDLLAVKEGYARAFHLGKNGQVETAAQFNGRNARARIRMATVSALGGGDARMAALYDSANRCVSIHARGPEGADFAAVRQVETDDAEYQAMESFDLDGDGRDDLLLVAPDRISVFYTRPLDGGLETLATAKTNVEDGGFGYVETGQLVEGGTEEVIALEMKDASLEMFEATRRGDGKEELSRLFRFRVFESDASIARRVNLDAQPEPRAIRTADLNDDGRPDLAILVHDRVIVYYQLDPDAKSPGD